MKADPPNYVEVTRGRSKLRADLIEGLLEQSGLRYRRLGTRRGEMVEAAQGIFVQRFEVHPDDAEQARALIADFDARSTAEREPDEEDGLDSFQARGRVVFRIAGYVGVALLLILLGMMCLPRAATEPPDRPVPQSP